MNTSTTLPTTTSSASLRRTSPRRHSTDRLMRGLCVVAAVVVLIPLFAILAYVIIHGASAISGDFFTQLPTPPGQSGGGAGSSIVGSLIVIAVASVVGLPIGLGSGIFLAEFGRNRFGDIVRFLVDVLAGLPSIVAGLVAYGLLVATTHQFSAFSGGVALGILMFPTVTRSTEAVLLLVPNSLREGSLALGSRRWQAVMGVVVPAAAGGIATSIILGIARVAGETAPLLFTAFGSDNWPNGLFQPIDALPLRIFNYATSPYDDWRATAWAGALVLVSIVLALNLVARGLARRFGTGAALRD